MTSSGAAQPIVSGVVEGDLDEIVLRRLAEHLGFSIGPVFGRKGKEHVREKLQGYNQAAKFSPWIVLVDLDSRFDCAPSLCTAWLPSPAEQMYFRVAVREIESWLLADRPRIAAFLAVSERLVPGAADELQDPKQALIDLAKRSRRRAIREDMVPREGSGATIGPAYTSRMMEFVGGHSRWRPEVAAQASPSLSRCIRALRAFAP